MDTGVYASYPKRRRYRTKSAYGKRRSYRKRVNPINQYSYKKTRIGRYFKTDQQSVMCSYKDYIYQEAGGAGDYRVGFTALAYLNLAQILAQSQEFQSRASQYSYYKLSGMKVTVTRRWIDPIALGVNGVSAGWLSLASGLSKVSMNFYPNLINTTVGTSIDQADSSFDFSPYTVGEQSHYIPFPKDFTTGSNSQGLGVWNAIASFSTIFGELALFNSGAGLTVPSNMAIMQIWDLDIEVYTQFCNNTGF